MLNELVGRADFFKAESWVAVELSDDLKDTAPDNNSDRERRHRNLKRLAAAFPRSFAISDEAVLTLAYAGIPVQIPIPFLPSQIDVLVDQTIISVLAIFLGFFGIFSSLLVTAGLIPRTFEPGEISLLLSKPVRRWVLFVTKFFGGCMFTLFCATLLVSGVVFLLWLRFDRWRPELMWSVPLYVFLFAIYFSVSALAGAIWRNPIVSMSLVIGFWVVLFVAGLAEGLMGLFLTSQQVTSVTIAGNEVFMTDMQRTASRWDQASGDWKPILTEAGDNDFERAMQNVTGSGRRPKILATADGRSVTLLNPTFSRGTGASIANVVIGNVEDGYKGKKQATTTSPVLNGFLAGDAELVVVGTTGVSRFTGANEKEQKVRDFVSRRTGGMISAGTASAFKSLTQRDYPTFSGAAVVAMNSNDASLVYCDKGRVTRAVRDAEGIYSVAATRELGSPQAALIAVGASTLAIAAEDGSIRICDATTLNDAVTGTIPAGKRPRAIDVSSDGTYAAVLTHSGDVVIYSAATGKLTTHSSGKTDETSVIGFNSEQKLVLSNGRRAIRIVEPETLVVVRSFSGSTGVATRIFDYVVHPLYTVLPKPSEVESIISWIVTGEKTVAIGDDGSDDAAEGNNLQQTRITLNLWGSFWSNVAFVSVMLLLGCLYLSRRDF